MITLNNYRKFGYSKLASNIVKMDEAEVLSFNVKKDRDGSAISTFVVDNFSDIKKGDIIHVVKDFKFSLFLGVVENIIDNNDSTFTISATYAISVLKIPFDVKSCLESEVSLNYVQAFSKIQGSSPQIPPADYLYFFNFGFYINETEYSTDKFGINKTNLDQVYTFLDCVKNMISPEKFMNPVRVFFSNNFLVNFTNINLDYDSKLIFSYDNGEFISKKKNNTISTTVNKLILAPSNSNILFKEETTYYLLEDGTISKDAYSEKRIVPVKAAMIYYSDEDVYNKSLDLIADDYFSKFKATIGYEFSFKAPVSETKIVPFVHWVEDKSCMIESFNPFQPVYIVENGKSSPMLYIEEISYNEIDDNGNVIFNFKVGKTQSPISKSLLEINQKLESNRTNYLANISVKSGTTSPTVTGAQAIGNEAYSGIGDQVSFDSVSRNSTLSLKDTDHIFFRNENLKSNETSKADYSAGKTLTQILSEGGQGGGISSVQISGTGNAVTTVSYNATSKILYLYKNSTFALSTDISQVVLTATLGLGVLNNNTTWGTTTSSNGYTVRWGSDQAGGGGFVLSEKDGKTYLQIDGDYYGNEGQSRVAYYSDLSSYALKSDLSSYVKSKESDNSNIYSEIINHATRGITLEYHLNSNPNARVKIVDGEITAGIYYEQGEDDDYFSEIKLDNYQISYKSTDGDYESVLTKEGLFSPHSGVFFKNNASIPHGAGIHKINGNLALQSSSNRIWIYNLNNRAGTFDFSNWIGGQDPTYYFPSKGGTFALTSDTLKNSYHLGAYDSVSGNTITRQTGYAVFDGSNDENWASYNAGFWAYITISDITPTTSQQELGQFIVSRGNAVTVNKMINTSSGIQIGLDGRGLNIRPNVSGVNTLATFKQWLSQNPIIIQYKLATSYTEQVINDRPLNTLDQSGSQWLRSEWEKGLNILKEDVRKLSNWVIILGDVNLKAGVTYNLWTDVTFPNGQKAVLKDVNDNILAFTGYTFGGNNYFTLSRNYSGQINLSGTFPDVNPTKAMINEGNHAYPYQEYRGGIVREKELKNYLPLSGGTITANYHPGLTINSVYNDDVSMIYFSRNSYNQSSVGYAYGMAFISGENYPYPKIGIVTNLHGNAGTVPVGKPFYSPDNGQTMYQLATTDQISAGQLLIKEFYAYSSTMTDFQNWMRANSNTVISVIYYNYAFGDNYGNSVIFNIDDNVYKYVRSDGTFGNVALYSDEESSDDLIRVYYRG